MGRSKESAGWRGERVKWGEYDPMITTRFVRETVKKMELKIGAH